jgi:predicted RNase H-like nuclease
MNDQPYVLGVDGCRAGWLVATRFLDRSEFNLDFADSFRSILDGPGRGAAAIMVDMPIGLADAGSRVCETEARRRLGPRRASVFSSPLRAMLAFDRYEDANAFGKARGRGLSRQAWMIAPKIKEIDGLIALADQRIIGEAHPELAFAALGGRPCAHPKRTPQGAAERRRLLETAGVRGLEALVCGLRERTLARSCFAADDALDAIALTMTAAARLEGRATALGDGARDARGLRMEIWAEVRT